MFSGTARILAASEHGLDELHAVVGEDAYVVVAATDPDLLEAMSEAICSPILSSAKVQRTSEKDKA